MQIDFKNVDCMEYMRSVPDQYFDLAIVDPPYGIGVDGNNLIENNSDKYNKFIKEKTHKWDSEPPSELYFAELIRVSAAQIIWGGNYFLDYLGYCKAPIIWNKLNGGSMYADGEMAWTGGEGMPRNLKIWNHQWCGAFKDSERGIQRIHPTQKPVKLYEWLLSNYAKTGDKILDTHGGSMSSAIACYNMGFDLVICELDKDYFDAGKARFENHIKQIRMVV